VRLTLRRAVKGFTTMSQQLHPARVMLFLDTLYNALDMLVDECGVYKVRVVIYDRMNEFIEMIRAVQGRVAHNRAGCSHRASALLRACHGLAFFATRTSS
jgi:hypothetical protein